MVRPHGGLIVETGTKIVVEFFKQPPSQVDSSSIPQNLFISGDAVYLFIVEDPQIVEQIMNNFWGNR